MPSAPLHDFATRPAPRPETPERNDGAGTVTMVCTERSSGPRPTNLRCIPYGPRAAADALSVCRGIGYENALMRPYAQTWTALSELSIHYGVTFGCVDSADE